MRCGFISLSTSTTGCFSLKTVRSPIARAVSYVRRFGARTESSSPPSRRKACSATADPNECRWTAVNTEAGGVCGPTQKQLDQFCKTHYARWLSEFVRLGCKLQIATG